MQAAGHRTPPIQNAAPCARRSVVQFSDMWSVLGAMVIGVRTAVSQVAAQPMRSALTMLGIAIGAGSLVSVLVAIDSVGRLAEFQTLRFSSAATLTLSANSANPRSAGAFRRLVVFDDGASLRDLRATLNGRATVTVEVASKQQVRFRRYLEIVDISASDRDMRQLRTFSLEIGRLFTHEEISRSRQVAVVNAVLAEALRHANGRPFLTNSDIRISGKSYRVVGILAAERFEKTPRAYLPCSGCTPHEYQGDGAIDATISVQALTLSRLPGVRETVEQWLRERIGDWSDGIDVRDGGLQLDLLRKNERLFAVIAAAFCSITLLVGGIGIMNVQLVSLHERTREIGIRRAVGARRLHISMQFLSESLAFAFLGGSLGAAIGAVLTAAFLRAASHVIGLPLEPVATLQIVVVGMSVAVGTGIIFGWYPAFRASSMSSLDALRHE